MYAWHAVKFCSLYYVVSHEHNRWQVNTKTGADGELLLVMDDQPITPCHGHGPLVAVADDEVVQQRLGGPHLKRTWWTEESIGTASGLWLQTGADGELLLPIVLSRTGRSKC